MKHQKIDRPTTKLLALALSLIVAGAAGFTSIAPAVAQQQRAPKSAQPQAQPPSVPNQILVMVHAGADKDEVNDAIKNMDGKLIKTISNGKLVCQLIQVPPGKLNECMDKLSKDKEHFDDAQPNVITQKMVAFPPTPDDPSYAQQYHLANMNVPAAWTLNGSGTGVTVGVIDSGVIGTEVDLTPRVAVGTNLVTGGPGNTDQTPGVNPFQHGTFVSTCSMASTNNALLGASPAYLANIVPVNVFDVNSSTSDALILEALFYLEGKGIKLINMSINAPVPFTFSSKKFHKVLYSAFQEYYHSGGLLFNAAGNDGQFDTNGRSPGLIVISAIDSNSQLAAFSTRGNSIWFAAPGVNIVSGAGDNTIETASGTSFASPLAMSVAAQLWGLHPGWTNSHVLHAMQASATSPHGTERLFGFGQVNAGSALAQP